MVLGPTATQRRSVAPSSRPKAKTRVATSSSQGSRASKARCGVASSSRAPAKPPPRLMKRRTRSGTPSKGRKSRRQAQALARVPGSRATVLEALAATEGRPADTMAGMVTKEPPPAAAFIAPASRPAPNRISADTVSTRGSVHCDQVFCTPPKAIGFAAQDPVLRLTGGPDGDAGDIDAARGGVRDG